MADNKTQIIITAKDETRAAIASAQSGLQSLAGAAANIGLQLGALAAAGSAGGLVLFAKSAIDAADNMGKLSQKVGVSVEQLSGLEYAAKLSDVSLEQLGNGLKRVSANINEAASGQGEAAEAFTALGLKVTDASGRLRNADAVFGDVADKFAGMQDGAGKTAIAMALFGKAGAEMIPLLNQGRDGIAAMTDEARAFGLVIADDLAPVAEQFNDNLTKLGEASRGLGITIGSAVAPTLAQISEEFVSAAKGGTSLAETLGGGLKTTLETVAVVGANVVYVFKAIGTEIGGIAAQMAALTRGDLQGFQFIGEAMKEDAAKARAELEALEKRIFSPERATAGDRSGLPDAPAFGADKGKKGKTEKGPSAEDLAYGGYKGAYKDFTEAIKRIADDQAAAADAEVEIEKKKAERIKAVVEQTYDGKLELLQKELTDAAALLEEGLINESQWAEFANVRIEAFTKTKDAGVDAFKELERAIEGWGRASADAFVEFAFTGKMSFADLTQSILKDLAKMVVYQNVTKPLFSGLSSVFGGFFGAGTDAGVGTGASLGFDSLFGGARANGGPVNAGNYYVVGERGPEILVPGASGTIIPNHELGGGGAVVSNVTVNMAGGGSTAEGDAGQARDLSRRIEAAVRGVLMVEKRPGGMLA